jgi:murein DD-endopeptidase MepM/ murein hydrolase activator NlpD
VIIYRAEPGDALWTVARKFGISPMTVWWANRLLDKDTLKIGQRMRILPTSGIEHLVREGDTLDAIARGYRADAEVIAAYNGLVGGVVVIGQRLIIPGGHGAPYAPVTEVSRQTTVPRLRPGQAGFAAVDRPAVAGPVAVPTAPGPTVGGGKTTLGVDWPQPDDASAGPGGHPGHDGSLGHDGSHGGPSVGPGAGGPVYWDGWGESAFWDTITIPPGGGRDSPPDDGRSIVFIDEHGRPVPASRAGTDAPGDDGSQFVFVVRPPQRPDPAPGGRPGGGSGPGGDGPDGDAPDRAPVIVIPDDAPRTGGRYPLPDPDWPDGGPDPGPSHGVWIDPDDRRLRLTPERALEERALFWPVYGGGRVSQHYHDEHLGLDIAAPQGTPILAAHEGIVVYRGWRDARGANQVWIKHGDRIWTMYLHLHSFAVRRGEWVEQGQVIGYMGSTGYSTGPHLHFNVVTGAAPAIGTGDRRDPLPYLWRPR